MPTSPWQKSTYSGDSSNCLEVAAETGGIKLRESDDPTVVLTATTEELRLLMLRLQANTSTKL